MLAAVGIVALSALTSGHEAKKTIKVNDQYQHDHDHHHVHHHHGEGEKKGGCPFAKMFGGEQGGDASAFAEMHRQFGFEPDTHF